MCAVATHDRSTTGLRALGAALALWLAGGCATSGGDGSLNRPALRASHPRTIALVLREPPAPGYPKLTFCLGAECYQRYTAAAYLRWWNSERSNELAQSNGIEDPAVEIGRKLAAAIARVYLLQPVDGVVARAAVAVDDLAKPEYPQADLILVIATTGWGFGPIGRGQSHVTYRGTLTLVDKRSKAVVAQGSCVFNPLRSDDDPLYDDLVANNAALLKERLHDIEETCADEYGSKVLGIYSRAQ
jgi:hypothetical protein